MADVLKFLDLQHPLTLTGVAFESSSLFLVLSIARGMDGCLITALLEVSCRLTNGWYHRYGCC